MVGNIKHVINRGIEKGRVFRDDNDYFRFVGNLYRLNNKNGALRIVDRKLFTDPPTQAKLVDVLKWSLLPNHYHLLLYELVDGGITEFTKRIGNAYTKYINIKNERSGYLFQNSAKIINVESERHFLYLPIYIDLNPLDLFNPRWKEEKIKEQVAVDFLKKYRWSSFGDYFDEPHFPSVINKDRFYEVMETSPSEYLSDFCGMIGDPSGLNI